MGNSNFQRWESRRLRAALMLIRRTMVINKSTTPGRYLARTGDMTRVFVEKPASAMFTFPTARSCRIPQPDRPHRRDLGSV
jgi:hypothetical protein